MTDPPPITQRDGVVTVQGDAVPMLYRCVLAGIARHHRDGLSSPPLLHQLRAALFRAVMSVPRHELADAGTAAPCCACQNGSLIGTAQAAEILSLSPRQVTRLAAQNVGLGRRLGRAWVLRSGAVLALAERRKAAK